MADSLFIGELARRSGRSIHTIRWYEAQGLMPGVMRDRGRRRLYNPEHVLWLELVDRLRVTGMTIAEIRGYSLIVRGGRATRPRLREVLVTHAICVRERLEQQRDALKFIEKKIAFYDTWIATGTRPTIPKLPKARR